MTDEMLSPELVLDMIVAFFLGFSNEQLYKGGGKLICSENYDFRFAWFCVSVSF